MTTTALEPSQIIPPGINANPDLKLSKNLLQNNSLFAALTDTQLKILAAIAENTLSEVKLCDREIAVNIGVHRTTISRNRQDKDFNLALSVMIREIIKGNVDTIIHNIYKTSTKDWQAGKFLLQYIDYFVTTTKNLNLNASVDASGTHNTVDSAIDSYLTRLIAAGWTPERLSERMRALMAEGVR